MPPTLRTWVGKKKTKLEYCIKWKSKNQEVKLVVLVLTTYALINKILFYYGLILIIYQISNELEQEQCRGCPPRKEWNVWENLALAWNLHRKLPRTRSVSHSYVLGLLLEHPLCTLLLFLWFGTLCLCPYLPISGIPSPPFAAINHKFNFI